MLATRRLSVRPFTNATPAGVPVRAVSVRTNASKLTSFTRGSEVEISSVRQQGRQASQLRTRAAEPDATAAPAKEAEPAADTRSEGRRGGGGDERGGERRGRRGPNSDVPAQKHFLPLPKPAHLVFIKPTVAVVTDVASRNSVGLKMTAGNAQLERFVIEYYARSVK